MEATEQRKLAAKVAQEFCNEEITFDQFLERYPDDTKDRDIEDLFDLIEHWPKRGGLLGANESKYQFHLNSVGELISRLTY
ncbi:MAG: hypothetical protein RH948_16010 [Cyclobacteriaceae bacterium]